jgi:hypothetical protein
LRPLRVHTVEVAAQPVHRRGDRELRATQGLDEITALAAAGVLQRGQHFVERGESPRYLFRRYRAPGQHTVPVQQQLGLVVGPNRGIRLGGGQR